jgi:hypothetical protein
VACGREGDPRPNPTASAAAPVGTLRFAYPDEPPTLDPLAPGGASSETRDILRPLLPALFRLNAKLRPEPDLVAAWPAPSNFTFDPFSVTLKLRKASWSDGQPITSTDVSFSAAKLRAGPTGYRYRYLKSVDVLTPRTLRLRFDRPLRRWWSLFSLDDMVLPAHAYSSAWSNGPTVSGGPFVFKSWTKGFDIKLDRNATYFGDAARLSSLDIEFVPDDETRLQLLRSHQIDAFFAEGNPNMGRRANAYGFPDAGGAIEGHAAASGVWGPTWIELDLDAARLSASLRRAIVEGSDPALAAEIFEDTGRRLDALPPSFRSPGTSQPWLDRGDVKKAAALAKGMSGDFELAYPEGPAGAVANFMHFHLAPAMTAELAGVEPSLFEKSWVPERSAPATLRVRRGADAPDADAYGADDNVAAADTTGAGIQIRTGLDPAPWIREEASLAQAATVAPLVQLRTWIVAGDGVFGPRPTGTSEGPFVDAATWRIENRT